MRKIYKRDIPAIALGASVLGTGGGGDPKVGRLLLEASMSEDDFIEMVSVDEVPDEAVVISLAYVGAPIISLEKLENVKEILRAFDKMEEYLGKKIFGVLPAEIGGANSLVPFHVSLARNIPLIDCDGLGRAFPYIKQSTFNLNKVSGPPLVQSDEKGNVVVYEAVSGDWLERLLTATIIPMGGQSAVADNAINGRQLKKAAIRGSISLAYKIGKSILQKNENKTLDRLLDTSNGVLLFKGKIVDVVLINEGRFNSGKCIIDGLNEFKGQSIEIDYQNEFLIAKEKVSQIPLAMTPDLITLVHSETIIPIGAESLKYGILVTVIGIPCDPQWRTKEGLELVGPKAFNYDLDFTPVEERYSLNI